MFRVINHFNVLRISTETVNHYSSTFNVSFDPTLLPVKKNHRKPRWVPKAKSKLFKVPKRSELPEDEEKEILRLNNNYRNNIKSIRKYLIQEHCIMYQASLDPEEILKHFKEDLKTCLVANDEWNIAVKATREKRLSDLLEGELDFARKRIEQESIKEEQIYELAEDLVRKEKGASVSFITPDNIDEAIDKALLETVDYNFAIDTNGEKILGRETRPIEEPGKVSVKQ